MTPWERDIWAILRLPYGAELGPRPARQPVLGSRKVVLSPARADTDQNPPPDTLLRIEPGLLAFSGNPSWPLSIYTTNDLDTWLSGPGWSIPGANPPAYTHFVGRMTWTELDGPRWPDSPPITGLADGAYTSALYVSAAAMDAVLATKPPAARLNVTPHAHTGPARMLAEACLASGHKLSDRVPPGCSRLPGRLQLIWSGGTTGSRQPWALDISDAGLVAHPLRVSARTRQILTWIEDEAVTGIAKHLAWLYVLADLTPDPGLSPVSVLSSATLAAAYQYGGPGPAMAGWVAPPYTGEPGLEMSCVLGGTLQTGTMAERYITQQGTITVSAFESGDPSATVALGSPSEWRVDPRCLLYVGTPDGSAPLRNHPTYSGPVSGYPSSPVLCAYTRDGVLKVFQYWSELSYAASNDNDGGSGSCGTGHFQEYSTGLSKLSVGYGWNRPPLRLVGSGSVSSGAGSWENESWEAWGPGGTGWGEGDYSIFGCSTNCGEGSWYPYTDEFSPITCYHYYGGIKFQVITLAALAVGKMTSYAIGSGDLRQVGVYWPGVPDAVWLASVSLASSRECQIETRKFTAWKEQKWRARRRWVNCDNADQDDIGPEHHGVRDTSWDTFWSTAHQNPVVSTMDHPSAPTTWDDTSEFWLAGEVMTAGDWGDWNLWWPEPIDGATIGVTAAVSAYASAVWIAIPGGDWSNNDLSGIPPLNLTQGWAGA